MIVNRLLTLITLALFFYSSHASNPAGAEITYRYLSSNKFEITYKVYRDCRGTPATYPDYAIRCSTSGTSKSLTATRISIRDINNSCKSAGIFCNPPNTTVSTTEPVIEEHTYMDTLDFNGSESAFKSCCIIQIGAGKCCRNGAISSGAAGNDFWVISTIDLCKANTNSSPVFTYSPEISVPCNVGNVLKFGAKDTIDHDSLSYNFTDPLTSWTGKTSWSGKFDFRNPFTAYYPSSYNRAKGPNPDFNPPIGIHMDSTTGNITGTPVSCSETTIMAVTVSEWRKDNKGKYQLIGQITRDIQTSFITSSNHKPVIYPNVKHNLCEGQSFTLDITTDDQPFNQPPPKSAIKNDTVTLQFDKTIKDATYTISNSNGKLPTGKFTWTPSVGDSKKSPFMFSAIATDNNCKLQASVIKTFKLYVFPVIDVKTVVTKQSHSTYLLNLSVGNKTYNYVTGKSVSSKNPLDSRSFYFKSNSFLYSSSESDTIVFKKNGQFIIATSFLSETECNSKTLYDTINVTNVMEVSIGSKIDTVLCQNAAVKFQAKVINGQKPIVYTWKHRLKSVSDTLGYLNTVFTSNDTVNLEVKDATGKTNSTLVYIKVDPSPRIYAGRDTSVCPGTNVYLKAVMLKKEPIVLKWEKDGIFQTNSDSFITNKPGQYILSAYNGCTTRDTLKITNFIPSQINFISGEYCQGKNELKQDEIFLTDPNLNFKQITWSLHKSLPKPNGLNNKLIDLLTDLDPTNKFDFSIKFDKSMVEWPSTIRDSLVFKAFSIDKNGCPGEDVLSITLIKTPQINVITRSPILCLNAPLDLDSAATTNGTYTWLPFFRQGYGEWPSYNPIASGFIPANYFTQPKPYKVKIESLIDYCKTVDSLVLNVRELPMPEVTITISSLSNSVRYKDNTPNIVSRKWSINGIEISTADSLILSSSSAHLAPVKLQLISVLGCVIDTVMIVNTVGIHAQVKSQVIIYPNPASSILNIKQPDNWKPSRYEVYDIMGKLVASGKTEKKEESLDISGFKTGCYYFKYYTETGVSMVNFIKSEY